MKNNSRQGNELWKKKFFCTQTITRTPPCLYCFFFGEKLQKENTHYNSYIINLLFTRYYLQFVHLSIRWWVHGTVLLPFNANLVDWIEISLLRIISLLSFFFCQRCYCCCCCVCIYLAKVSSIGNSALKTYWTDPDDSTVAATMMWSVWAGGKAFH